MAATRQILIEIKAEGGQYSAEIRRMTEITNQFNDKQLEYARNCLLKLQKIEGNKETVLSTDAAPISADDDLPAVGDDDPDAEDDKPP